MGLRYDLPRIPAKEEPTIWNSTMAKYAFFSGLIGSFLAGITDVPGPEAIDFDVDDVDVLKDATVKSLPGRAVEYSAMGVGASIGGSAGRDEMRRELSEGKIVRDPTFWNKGLFSGFMAVSVPTVLAATALALLASPVTLTVTVAAIGGIGSLVAAVTHGFGKRSEMKEELQLAKDIAQYQQMAQARGLPRQILMDGPAPVQSYKNSVTPQEYALLEARLAAGKNGGAGHAQAMQQQPAAAMAAPQPTQTA